MYSELYSFIAENKDLFRFFYSAIIVFICFIIVMKTDRLFKISSHQGIRYFRNAFLFYGIAFALRYVLGLINIFLMKQLCSIKMKSLNFL